MTTDLRRSLWILTGIIVAFLVFRVPLAYRLSGAQDEEWYAVPGVTVAREGIPRVPYARNFDPETIYYKAHEVIFAELPASFYLQGLFCRLFGPSYGSTRMAAAAAGVVAIVLVFCIGRYWLNSDAIGLWAATLYSLSRQFYFPATTARPDMLCTACGLAAILMMWFWSQRGQSLRMAAAAGCCLGLSVLSHPFAIVFGIQVGLWMLIGSRSWRSRLLSLLTLGVVTSLTISIALPLVLAYPDIFVSQFGNNILKPAGPGLLSRLIMPWDSIAHHAHMQWTHASPLQFVMQLSGLTIATIAAWRVRPSTADARADGAASTGLRTLTVIAWSGLYLTVTCVGLHPTTGYWCYFAALSYVAIAWSVVRLAAWIGSSIKTRFPLHLAVGLCMTLLMIPGSGVRTWVAHVRHWNDPNYDRSVFVKRMLTDFPADARYTVTGEFLLDVYLSGRPTTIGTDHPMYFDCTDIPYDYLIVGRADHEHLAEKMNGKLIATYGDEDELFACYAEVYRPSNQSEN